MLRLLLVTLTCGALLVGTSTAGVSATSTATTGSSSSASALAAKAVPGVQLIETTYSGTVVAQIPTIDQTQFQGILERLVKQAQSGLIGTSEASIVEALVDIIVKEPGTFIVASGQSEAHPTTVTGVGTGFVVTPDGYLVTAAHVVKGMPDELAQSMASKELQAASDAFVQGLTSGDQRFTPDQVNRLRKVVLDWYAAHLEVRDLSTEVAALIGESSGTGKKTRRVAAKVIEAGEVYPGNDVAVLKIDGVSNMPTETLGTDDDVEIGSTLHVVGYPAASTFNPSFSEDTLAQPNVTEGPLTARKTTTKGMPVFQTQAPSSPGNSGGPVLADNGQVIGVLVAGAVEDGQALEGQGYVIPVSEVTKMLSKNQITPTPSETSTIYNQAIDDYYAKHYSAAKPKFAQVLGLYPQHPFAPEYESKADKAIADGLDQTPADNSTLYWVGGSGLLLLVVLGGVAALVANNKKRQPQQQPQQHFVGVPVGGQGGAQPWPPQPPQHQPQPHQQSGWPTGQPTQPQQQPWQQQPSPWQAPPNQPHNQPQNQPHNQPDQQQPPRGPWGQ